MLWLAVVSGVARAAVGEVVLTDGAGFSYALNDEVTYNTTASGSAACSDAGFVHAVPVSTATGGVTSTTLEDAFDGYLSLVVDVTPYRPGGAAVEDADCAGREWVWPEQIINGLTVQRKVYVPADAPFARWIEVFRNESDQWISPTITEMGNLGSDADTVVVNSSSGDAWVDPWETWAITRDGPVLTPTTDPRLLHLWGAGQAYNHPYGVQMYGGTEDVRWTWYLGLAPGDEVTLLHVVSGAGSVEQAQTTALWLEGGPDELFACLSKDELSSMYNAKPCSALDDGCSLNAWNPENRRCEVVELLDFAACDDGLECTREDTCYAGTCHGEPVLCVTDACEASACVEGAGCLYEEIPDGGFCEDGDPCTDGETCAAGLCDGGAPVCVDDGATPVTPEEPTTFSCQHIPVGEWSLAYLTLGVLLLRRRGAVTVRDR
jgi:hypothetical protein